ncbi:MAG: hypothetical protein ACYTG0_37000 [Planctomycetota bacterium]|jgi:hypothetical protein
MATFILCWHKTKVVEEVEAPRVNKEWYGSIAYSHLDVLKVKDGKVYILDSAGAWSRVKKKESTSENTP